MAHPDPGVPAVDMRAVHDGDALYPRGLRDLRDPPATLYVRGTLPDHGRSVALVGSRAATPYGLRTARRLAADLSRAGVVIVSGLARGIDAAAHRGALDAAGVTVGFLPGGLDRVTPVHHRELARQILARGVWLSERPPGTAAHPGLFIRRNRLIAAYAAVTVVVEAARRSGALSTAGVARRLGRPVLAVPGDIDRETSRGCNALLRQGAGVCEDAADVLARLERLTEAVHPAARLRAGLGATPRPVDALARAAGLSVRETLAQLLLLQWRGEASPRPGQCWVGRSEGDA